MTFTHFIWYAGFYIFLIISMDFQSATVICVYLFLFWLLSFGVPKKLDHIKRDNHTSLNEPPRALLKGVHRELLFGSRTFQKGLQWLSGSLLLLLSFMITDPVYFNHLFAEGKDPNFDPIYGHAFLTTLALLGGVGAIFRLLVGISTFFHQKKCLKYGILTDAILIEKEEIPRQKDEPYLNLTFEYHDQSGTAYQHQQLAFPELDDAKNFLDDSQEALFYLPEKPSKTLLFDEIWGGLKITEKGSIAPVKPGSWYFYILPTITLILLSATLYRLSQFLSDSPPI